MHPFEKDQRLIQHGTYSLEPISVCSNAVRVDRGGFVVALSVCHLLFPLNEQVETVYLCVLLVMTVTFISMAHAAPFDGAPSCMGNSSGSLSNGDTDRNLVTHKYHKSGQGSLLAFLFLFVFRYTRLLVNGIAYLRYKPITMSHKPIYSPCDVTVIVPTTEPWGESTSEVLQRILDNRPAAVIVAVPRHHCHWKPLANCFCYRGVSLVWVDKTNKRKQICGAMLKVIEFEQQRMHIYN